MSCWLAPEPAAPEAPAAADAPALAPPDDEQAANATTATARRPVTRVSERCVDKIHPPVWSDTDRRRRSLGDLLIPFHDPPTVRRVSVAVIRGRCTAYPCIGQPASAGVKTM